MSFVEDSRRFTVTPLYRYLRIKRRNQTYFIMCTEDTTLGSLKEQIAAATGKEVDAASMRLISKANQPLGEDTDKLSQHTDLKNDAELYVVFQIGDGEWEEVQVEDTDAAVGGGAPP